MNIEIGSLLVAGAKSLGETLLNELKNYLDNKKNWGQGTNLKLSEDAKVEVLEGERKILGQYTDIYQIRNGEIYKFNNNEEPEYIGNTELENGIYRKNENKFLYNMLKKCWLIFNFTQYNTIYSYISG